MDHVITRSIINVKRLDRRLDFRHGLVLGSGQFVDKIRRKYLPDKPQPDLPQQRSLSKSIDAKDFTKKAGKLLRFDLGHLSKKRRRSGADKENRDLLIYFLWHSGKLANTQIGELFSISYSAVSHAVTTLRAKLKTNHDVDKKMDNLYSQFTL